MNGAYTRPFLILIFLIFSFLHLYAQFNINQQLISSIGHQGKYENKTTNFSVGEAVISTLNNPFNVLTQGFFQPEPFATITYFEPKMDILIYPNPTSDLLCLEWQTDVEYKEWEAQIFNALGQFIFASHVFFETTNTFISCKQLPIGYYFLQIRPVNKMDWAVFRFIKME